MREILAPAGKMVWQMTPSRAMREFYLKAFLGLARNRKTVKTIEGMTFEPTKSACRKLQINATLKDFSHLHADQLALSDRNLQRQRIDFRSSWRSDGSRSDAGSIVDFQRPDGRHTQQNVDHVDMIEIDVDGDEFAVMSGGERVISACRPMLLIEVGTWHFTDPGRNPLELLHALGYRFWDSKTLVEYPDLAAIRRLLPEKDEELGFSMNLLAATRFPEPRQTRDS